MSAIRGFFLELTRHDDAFDTSGVLTRTLNNDQLDILLDGGTSDHARYFRYLTASE